MLSKNNFWNTVISSIESLPQTERRVRSGLYDMAIASFGINNALALLPEYLNNNCSLKTFMDFTLARSVSFNLNYYLNNPETKKEDINRVRNLIDLSRLLRKLENKIERKIDILENSKKMIKILQMLSTEAKEIILEEIERYKLKEILKAVEDKKQYLKNFMGISISKKMI